MALLVPTGAMASAGASPGCSAAVCQYVESVPTSSGSVTPGVQKDKKVPVPKKTQRVLNSTSRPQTHVLKRIISSTGYGATSKELAHRVKEASDNKVVSASVDPSVSSSLSAALGSPGSGSGDRLLGLLAVVIVITGVFVVVAARKQRSRNQL